MGSESRLDPKVWFGDQRKRLCFPSSVTYLARTVPPTLTGAHFRILDRHLATALLRILSVNLDDAFFDSVEGAVVLELIQAPSRFGGTGILSTEHMSPEAYLGSIALVSSSIVKRSLLGPNFSPDQQGASSYPHFMQTLQTRPNSKRSSMKTPTRPPSSTPPTPSCSTRLVR